MWQLFIDSIDGDADLSYLYRTSVDPPGNWDFVNMMTYSSYYPESWQGYYVYLMERGMGRLYSDVEPSHLIGLVSAAPWEPVLDFDELVRDARITRAMGVQEIVVYRYTGLEDVHHNFGARFVSAVNDVPSDLAVVVPFSRPASLLLFLVLVADGLLDVFNWKMLFFLIWAIVAGGMVYWQAVGNSTKAVLRS